MLQSKVIFELIKILNEVYLNFDYALFKLCKLIYNNFKDTQANMEMFEELDTSVISLKAKNSKEVYNLLSGPKGIYLPFYNDCNCKFLRDLL